MELRMYDVTKGEVQAYFEGIVKETDEELKALFSVALNSANFALFPHVNTRSADYRGYISQWIGMYRAVRSVNERNFRAFQKTMTEDLSVVALLSTALDVEEKLILEQLKTHNAFMSAEGVQGYLLEQYVASVACEHGLLHASGILKAVDFCAPDGSLLLQIKNKNNSEASPSVRTGLKIKLWYRVTPRKCEGKATYLTNWEKLNEIVSGFSGKACNMSEEKFIAFIRKAVAENKNILSI